MSPHLFGIYVGLIVEEGRKRVSVVNLNFFLRKTNVTPKKNGRLNDLVMRFYQVYQGEAHVIGTKHSPRSYTTPTLLNKFSTITDWRQGRIQKFI